jgi:hypothetical protein
MRISIIYSFPPMNQILSNILILFSSTIKFGFSTLAVIAADLGPGGSITNLLGGLAGIVLFVYLGDFLRKKLMHKYPNRFGKRFSKSSRFLVKVKQKHGLAGVAFLTPVILSIPVGVMFSLALTSDKKKVMAYMMISCLLWAFFFSLPYYAFQLDVKGLLMGLLQK